MPIPERQSQSTRKTSAGTMSGENDALRIEPKIFWILSKKRRALKIEFRQGAYGVIDAFIHS